MGVILNNKFDTSKSFLDAIVDRCKDNLPDYMFNTACEEFEIEEEEAMEMMLNSDNYDFIRMAEGWKIKIRKRKRFK